MTEGSHLKNRKPWWFKLLIAVALLVVVLLISAWVMDIIGRKKLNLAIAEARAMGQPVSFEEILSQRKVWPADQDAGLYFLTIEPMLDEIPYENLKQLPLLGEVDLPPLGYRWSSDRDQIVSKQIASLAPTITQIDHLKDYLGGRIPFVIQQETVWGLMPSLAGIHFSAKLKALEILEKAMREDTAKLFDDFVVLTRHGQLLADHPSLIGSLVKVACDMLAVATIERVTALAVLNSSQLVQIDKQLSLIEADDSIYWGVLGERAIFIGTGDYLFKGGEIPRPEGVGDSDLPQMPSSPRLPGMRGWFMRDEAIGVEMLTRLIQGLDRSDNRLSQVKKFDAELQSLPTYYPLSKIVIPSNLKAFQRYSTRTAQIRAARVGLAIERFRIDMGSFPKHLEQLVPHYMKELLRDPFDNQRLRYKLTADAAIVYSIGEDGLDDGGDVRRVTRGQRPADAGFTVLKPERRRLPAEMSDTATQTATSAN